MKNLCTAFSLEYARLLHRILKIWFWANSEVFPSAFLASSKAKVCVASFELMIPLSSGYGEFALGF